MTSSVLSPVSAHASDDQVDAVLYELCVLYPVNLSQKEEQTLLKDIHALFEEAGGKLTQKDLWGRRGLAYPIKKQTEGNFMIAYYEIDPSKVKEIDRQLRILPNLLRHLIVKPPKGYVIVKYSERFLEWQKSQVTAQETTRKEEEQRLQKKVSDRAKVQAKRAEAQKVKKADAPRAAASGAEIGKKLDELISDDTIGL